MKAQRLLILVVSAIALIAIAVLAATTYRMKRQPAFQDLPGLISAMQAFSRDLTKQGQPLPPTVSLGELVSHAYISSNSVRAFDGMEVKIWLTVNDAEPQSVLLAARLPDGSVSAALADGSVQRFSSQRFAEHLKKTGQQDGTAVGGFPIVR